MNNTERGDSFHLFHELASRSASLVVLESMLYGGIAALALFGNLLVLCVVYKNPRFRTSNGWLVTSLAVSDIMMASLCAPQSLAAQISGRWISGFVLCQVQGFFIMWLSCASLETMALMSLDRYFRVVRPFKHYTLFTTKRVKLMIVGVWLLAFTAPLPYVAMGNAYVFHPGKMFCFYQHVPSIASCVIYGHVAVSLVVLTICYLKVFHALRANAVRVKNLQRLPASSRIAKEEIRLTKTLFVIVLGFLLCWTPILVIDSIGIVRGKWSLKRWIFVMYNNIGLLSSCLNPIIYGAMNKKFRTWYKGLFANW